MESGFEDFRMGHLTRTAALWRRLVELGVTEDTELDFDFSFRANTKEQVRNLQALLQDYDLSVTSEGIFRKTYTVAGNSGPITWSEEQLLKWVDYLIARGREAGCELDGCGASAPRAD